ncbi:hypothetical protein Sru01_66140 [Sphaerisporangium rufum]|uniref:Uncharacterized protein n=1 Tax=Sphaerisporangium rufum TaxID=1381558 RepID=A0A919R8J2_9ACTN|nr:hypothetical protein [Sphaerisporangium rufum]GII81632.1 hypothetical protein Sru01_66140 [Sphaerisporangium rufum]
MHVHIRKLSPLRRAAGFGAAAAMSLYLAVKLVWIALEISQGTADKVLLNAVTVVMALTGVALGLALAQPWGARLPDRLVLPIAWIAGGLLVSMIPYMIAAGLVAPSAPEPAATTPAWETALIGAGFAGMAVALLVGLPLFLRERWPRAFTGPVGGARADGRLRWALPPLLLLFAVWLSWASGGTLGLVAAGDVQSRLLMADSALCAAGAGWSLWALGPRGGGRRPVWPPMVVGFVTSGSLFGWGSWKLAWLVAGMYRPVELRWVAVVEHGVAMAAGLAVLGALIQAYRRRTGPPDAP